MDKPTYEELLETIIDLVYQGAERDGERIGHMFMSTYEDAFDVLERAGRLVYDDAKKYWAHIVGKGA